jgi:hypothetical protein
MHCRVGVGAVADNLLNIGCAMEKQTAPLDVVTPSSLLGFALEIPPSSDVTVEG